VLNSRCIGGSKCTERITINVFVNVVYLKKNITALLNSNFIAAITP
jgi:hypothetical protein